MADSDDYEQRYQSCRRCHGVGRYHSDKGEDHGVALRDQRDQQHHKDHDLYDLAKGQVPQQGHGQCLCTLAQIHRPVIKRAGQLLMQCGAAENGEPHHTEKSRQDPLDHDIFTHGAAIGNADHKQSQQRSESHPVDQPVHIPALRPVPGVEERRGIQAVGEEIIEIFAGAVQEKIDDIR